MMDVAVVGGSVAGAATALQLARRGHSVVLLERSHFPREKVCGEGLMPHGVAELGKLGLLEPLRATRPLPFTGIGYHLDGITAVGRFPDGATGLGVRRSRLDELLLRACEAEGVVVHAGERVRSVEIGGRVVVRTDQRSLEARLLVGADGLHSPLRKRLGLQGRPRGRARYGVRGHFRLAPGKVNRDRVDVYVDGDLELYVTPTNPGETNVALLCEKDVTRRFGGQLAQRFDAIVRARLPLLEGAEVLTEPRLTGPLEQVTTDVVADRAVLVGDAAGFVDAITGEGMSIGLISARIAADVVSRALKTNELGRKALLPYARRRRREARDLSLLTHLIVWGIRKRWLARRVVRNLARDPDLFTRVLAVNTGALPLTRFGVRSLLRLVR